MIEKAMRTIYTRLRSRPIVVVFFDGEFRTLSEPSRIERAIIDSTMRYVGVFTDCTDPARIRETLGAIS